VVVQTTAVASALPSAARMSTASAAASRFCPPLPAAPPSIACGLEWLHAVDEHKNSSTAESSRNNGRSTSSVSLREEPRALNFSKITASLLP